MPEILRIFVSATTDLENQRSIIARTLAELPVDIGAEIRRYPAEGASYETLFELIANVDRVYFLLGADITAPSGSEWDLALRLERPIVALRRPARLTPAAEHFLRHAYEAVPPSDWHLFRNDAELARIVGLDLIDTLLHPSNRYGLTLPEIDRLRERLQQLRDRAGEVDSEPGGAEQGAVILGRHSPSLTTP
ncbi:MAG: hypothetical protein D6791_11340 [Chloroflexi bacterium]|nr:MAG: hypothetical protein D6791_11340 [Chloroflexota bacterium]